MERACNERGERAKQTCASRETLTTKSFQQRWETKTNKEDADENKQKRTEAHSPDKDTEDKPAHRKR
eukprot:179002-Rhodomonas_salina.1